ncbi:TPA: hypothetical protein JLJ10_003178 [Escherichia coli]|nr:hypothetical protein [Escherichia coli]
MDYTNLIVVLGSIAVMILGLLKIFQRLKEKGQGFGDNSIKAIGVVLLIPTILIISITADFDKATVAALLGTISGYILSRDKES